jgi:hypothetical protein
MLPSDVLEDIRKRVEGGLGPLTKGGSDDLAGALLGKAQGAADQLSGFASAIGEWVAFAREFIRAEVRDVVDREVAEMGFASAKAVEALAARVERLERKTPEARHKKSGGKASSGEKAKRKALTRDLDGLTERVERLERDTGSAPARLRSAGSVAAATERPQNGRPARSARAPAASKGSPTSRAGAAGAKGSGGKKSGNGKTPGTGKAGSLKTRSAKTGTRTPRSVGSAPTTPAASDGATRPASGR